MKNDSDWPLLPGERRIRFGCGVIAGIFAGVELTSRYVRGSTIISVLLVVITAAAFGAAAALWGDRFWTRCG